MTHDLREAPYLDEEDILTLNFIRASGVYVYRRHYRTGLRSHIMEVLRAEGVENETTGLMINEVRSYPRAEPVKMLRIFRTRFQTIKDAMEELRRVKIIQSYLSPDHIARSEEFLVDYIRHGNRDILLCGLQDYVDGEILKPWDQLARVNLLSLFSDMGLDRKQDAILDLERWIDGVREKADSFVMRLKQMILKAGYVPDLAGVGNLILTPSGHIKLVDINNISRVLFHGPIPLDDRGYPVCDKSIRVMWLIEQKLAAKSPREADPIYGPFLNPKRLKAVKVLEEAFQGSI